MYQSLHKPLFFKNAHVRNKTVMSVGSHRYYENKEIRVKDFVFKIHNYCSDYLHKDTKECIAYWSAIKQFNQEIDYVYYTIQHKESPYLCEESFAEMDKMYDL